MKYILTILTAILTIIYSTAKDITATGEYTFYGNKSHSLTVCESYALEGARLNAIESVFGKSISSDIFQHDLTNDTYFSMFTNTEVNGEWICDIEEPKFTYNIDKNGLYIVTCNIKGKVQEKTNKNNIDIISKLLYTDTAIKSPIDNTFYSGDDLFLYFKTPIDGYLSIFLVGDKHQVFRLFPYTFSKSSNIQVIQDKEYILFSSKHKTPEHGNKVDELSLIKEIDEEDITYNYMYIVFSTNKFVKPNDSQKEYNLPAELSYKDFQKWIRHNMNNDPNMVIKTIQFAILSE